MKRFLTVMFSGGLILLIGVSTAQSHSFWAKYKENPVPEGENVPIAYITDDDTLNCCGCHGRISNIPALMCNDDNDNINGTALSAALADDEKCNRGVDSSCDIDIDIDIAPNVLNLEREGECVTVHTNIAYNIVDSDSVTLSLEEAAAEAYLCKADLRGNLVAKFYMFDISGFPFDTCDENTFKIKGTTNTGQCFCGTQDILVVDADCDRPL